MRRIIRRSQPSLSSLVKSLDSRGETLVLVRNIGIEPMLFSYKENAQPLSELRVSISNLTTLEAILGVEPKLRVRTTLCILASASGKSERALSSTVEGW